MKPSELLKKTELGVFLGAISLLPLVIFGSYANVIDSPKLAFLVLTLIILLVLKVIRSVIDNSISFNTSKFDIPVFLLAVTYIVSTVIETPNKMDALFLPGTTTLIVSAALIYFIANQLNQSEEKYLTISLFISVTIYSLVVLLSQAGLFSSIPQFPVYMKDPSFTTVGSMLAGVLFIISLLPIGIYRIIREKDIAQRALYGVCVSLMVFASVLGVYHMIPGGSAELKLPDVTSSWSVAVEAIKAEPLFGVGPGNYLSAFNRFRPISYNSTELWSLRFTTGRSYLFTLMTETGIAGLAAFALIVFLVFKEFKKDQKIDPVFASLVIANLALIVFPSSIIGIVIFFLLLSIHEGHKQSLAGSAGKSQKKQMFSYQGESSRLLVLVVAVPVLLLAAAVGYYLGKISLADFTYKTAITDIARGDGSKAYENLQDAISVNPYVDRYRVSYAQVNLAIANSLAAKESLTDEERQTIAQLIQQAIREGKVAVSLNPQRAGNWEMLGSIYRAVAPLAEGANNFAAQTYAQAIALDPYNPLTRIALGGLFYSAKQYENAIDEFSLAVRVKPDHANARYNLAIAYKENGQIDEAINEMSQVLALVERDSEDFRLATTTLEELKAKKAAADTSGSSDNLTPPSEDQTGLEPKLELPEEAEPPTPSPSPTPEATPSIEATPTPEP